MMDQANSETEELYAGHSSDNDSEQTEDDPLSDILSQDELEDSVTRPLDTDHEYVQIKTVSGVYKVDLTPPEAQLKNVEASVRYFYKKKLADDCLKEAVRHLTLMKIVEGDRKPWKLAACHAVIAKIYWNLKNYPDQTLEHATEAQRLLSFPNRSSEKPDKFEILDTALSATYLHGKSLLALKKFEESEEELQKAERLLEERRRLGDMKDKSFWMTEIYTAMARVSICQSNTNEALKYLRKVERIMQKRYGNESPRLVLLYHEMAKLEELRSKVETAIEIYLKAYSIAKSSFDEKSPQMGDAALALARAYSRGHGEDSEVYAESYFNEAIDCFSDSLGFTQAKTLAAQQELAALISKLGRKPEAISSLNQCIRRLAALGEEYDSKAAKIYKQLAKLCSETGRNRQAVQFLKNCLHIEELHYGPTSKKTVATKEELAALTKTLNTGRGQSLERSRFRTAASVETRRKFSQDS